MSGLPVTIRLLDPPLHEFLPQTEAELAEVAEAMGASPEKLKRRAAELHEFNPMLGFRGVRLAIAYPEIAEMQARAIFEAAVAAGRATGEPVTPEIMVPLVMTRAELDLVKERIDAAAEAVAAETGVTVEYQVGTMIELPRAALRAQEIAETAEFFSFGTNDLTQTALGISRDDAASFLGTYVAQGHPPRRPLRHPRPGGGGRARPHRGGARAQDAQRASSSASAASTGATRPPSASARVRARLRVLLALPGADRAARRGAGGAQRHGREPGVQDRLTRTDAVYGLWMLLVGAFVGLVVANDPSLARAPVPPIVWLARRRPPVRPRRDAPLRRGPGAAPLHGGAASPAFSGRGWSTWPCAP